MRLARVLKKDVAGLLPPDEGVEVAENTVCGSNAQHFIPSTSGRISVFNLDGSVDGRRVAIALAGSVKQPADMAWCIAESEALSCNGLGFDPVPGETFDAEVNAHHFDITGLSMFAMSKLATEYVRRNEVEVIDMWDIAAALSLALEQGLLQNAPLAKWLGEVAKSTAMKRAVARLAAES